jgi:hypothetical protein
VYKAVMSLSFARIAALLCLTGCVAPVGVEGVSVPPDSAKICAKHCDTIGMRLSAVAIMANNVGCVCQPNEPVKTEATPQARAEEELQRGNAIGMASVLMRSVEEQTRRVRSRSD